MAGDEYASVGGGSLKLKGVKGSKVDKQRKKKSKQPEQGAVADQNDKASPARDDSVLEKEDDNHDASETERPISSDAHGSRSTKTAAELRHEERRKKLLDERLKRDGVKTHKERVEELNKYLSGLSEHHDMPKIGPG